MRNMDDIQFTMPKKSADWLIDFKDTPERIKELLAESIVTPYGGGHQVVLSKPTLDEIMGVRFALEQAFVHWSIQCDKLPNNTSQLKSKNPDYAEAVAHRRKFGKLLDKMDDWPGTFYMPVGNPI